VSILFAAFLGFDPISHLVGSSTLAHLPPDAAAQLTSRSYFPSLIAHPFRAGLHEAFAFATIACLVAAAASWSRGGRYVHGSEDGDDPEALAEADEGVVPEDGADAEDATPAVTPAPAAVTLSTASTET
jgi:hypothetical protein